MPAKPSFPPNVHAEGELTRSGRIPTLACLGKPVPAGLFTTALWEIASRLPPAPPPRFPGTGALIQRVAPALAQPASGRLDPGMRQLPYSRDI
jgi:hypothetical protein